MIEIIQSFWLPAGVQFLNDSSIFQHNKQKLVWINCENCRKIENRSPISIIIFWNNLLIDWDSNIFLYKKGLDLDLLNNLNSNLFTTTHYRNDIVTYECKKVRNSFVVLQIRERIKYVFANWARLVRQLSLGMWCTFLWQVFPII